MAVLAGIDEAGYGPTLGPLVVTGTAFRVPDDRLDECLWRTLRATCAAAPARHGRRLLIADSKKLFRGGEGFAALERAALVMLAAAGQRPATLVELLDEVCPGGRELLQSYPWYTADAPALPVGLDPGDVATKANAVRRDLASNGVSLLGVFCELLPEGHFNRLVRNTRNKAVVLTGLALRVMERIRGAAADERIRICVDRLGGRQHYREPLADSWPAHEVAILEESEERSAYRLTRLPRTYEVEFTTEGESRHLPVALASIYSKYLRELLMAEFNRYWCAQLAGLEPTAGYYVDAQRWLRQAAPAISRLGVNRALLIRER